MRQKDEIQAQIRAKLVSGGGEVATITPDKSRQEKRGPKTPTTLNSTTTSQQEQQQQQEQLQQQHSLSLEDFEHFSASNSSFMDSTPHILDLVMESMHSYMELEVGTRMEPEDLQTPPRVHREQVSPLNESDLYAGCFSPPRHRTAVNTEGVADFFSPASVTSSNTTVCTHADESFTSPLSGTAEFSHCSMLGWDDTQSHLSPYGSLSSEFPGCNVSLLESVMASSMWGTTSFDPEHDWE